MFPDWSEDFGQDTGREYLLRQGIATDRFEPVGLPEGYHGRWSLLSVDDVKFLISVGIDPLS